MKSGRFTDAQIMGVIRQAEGGVPVPDLCREHGLWRIMGSALRWPVGFLGYPRPAFAIVRDWQRRTTGLPLFWWD
ncbi:hypothetical protein SRCM100623_00208 [Acetobacter pasteurianus]|uniref:Transposase n=1 Tax=Acetobacter pasteurianus TaxID=438 RepID=A0A1A0DPN4_ACEPA|nr:hypothetical protein SRCM100623_00208 [Acetobacter pasteurianus]